MFFRDLSIGASHHANLPEGFNRRDFNLSTHVVQDIFLAFMPSKYVLDGMAKTNLIIGPRNKDKQYEQLINVNMYFIDDFDFRVYFAASNPKKNQMILQALEVCLMDIAARSNADPTPIIKAIKATRECGFNLRYVIKSLSRLTPSRKLKLNVFRHICHEGESWGIDIVNRKGQVLESRWIAEKTDGFHAAYAYRRSKLVGDHFVLLGTLRKETYKLNVVQIERKFVT